MAEEKMDILFNPEIIELDVGNPGRNSTGKPSLLSRAPDNRPFYHRASVASCYNADIVKRKPTIKLSSKYLSASTGSCHDFCKYGTELNFAAKERNPIPNGIKPPPDKQKNREAEALVVKKNTSTVKLKPSPDKIIQSPEQNTGIVVLAERKKTLKLKLSPDLICSSEPPEIIKREILLPSKEVGISSKKGLSINRIMKDDKMKVTLPPKFSPDTKLKSVRVIPSSSLTATVGLNGLRKTPVKSGKITETSKTATKRVLEPTTVSLSPKSFGGRAVSIHTRKSISVKLASPLKDQNRTQKDELKKPDNDKVQEKTFQVAEVENENKILETAEGDFTSQIPSSPLLQSPDLSSYSDSQFLETFHDHMIKESEDIDREDVKHVKLAENENVEVYEYSNREDPEDSEYTESEEDDFISEDDETVNVNEGDASKRNHNQGPKKGRGPPPEDEDSALSKSKFRRGRILDLGTENNVPRRLRFRRGRIVGDTNDEKTRTRSFKNREACDDENGASPGSEKVILRHQDVQGKKDAQGLFNNVIEETASKLVESRKSKVKALVGAFETVISLQESNPSTPTGT